MTGISMIQSELEAVARPLLKVIEQFEAREIPYTVEVTEPSRATFRLEKSQMFVIRQRQDKDGKFHLTVAAKMGKEVPVSHGLQDF